MKPGLIGAWILSELNRLHGKPGSGFPEPRALDVSRIEFLDSAGNLYIVRPPDDATLLRLLGLSPEPDDAALPPPPEPKGDPA